MTNPFIQESGMTGTFTREEAEGAIPNGTTVVKTNSEKSDGNPDGSRGVVLGSMDARGLPTDGVAEHLLPLRYVYFVEWEANPKFAVGILDGKLRTEICPTCAAWWHQSDCCSDSWHDGHVESTESILDDAEAIYFTRAQLLAMLPEYEGNASLVSEVHSEMRKALAVLKEREESFLRVKESEVKEQGK